MKKVLLILLGNLMVFSLALIFTNKAFSLKLDNTSKEDNLSTSSIYDYDFILEKFDGAESKKVNIDIKNKKYEKNQVSIADSDFQLSEDLQTKIVNLFNNYGGTSSFYIVSLKDGMSIGYNVDSVYEAASSIKAPYAYYVYRLIDEGKVKADDLIEYQERHYNPGTGAVKNSAFGTKYTVEQLVDYSLHISDNVAHTMLHSAFGADGYNKMLDELGIKQLRLTKNNPWGFTSPRSAAIIWQDIYNYSISSPNGINFFNKLLNVSFNYFNQVIPDAYVASKAGWASKSIIDAGIIFDKNPYIAVAMAARNGNYNADDQVLEIIKCMDEIMNEYEAYLEAK